MQSSSPNGCRYAVLFRTHFWDDFAERQYVRLKEASGSGDVFVLVDETAGPVRIGRPGVIGHTADSALRLGLARAGHGNLLWFNGDYPLYLFFQEHRTYDYYVMAEYDVVVLADLDVVLGRLQLDRIDFVGLSKGEPVSEWALASTCIGVYPPGDVQKRLICLAMFSNRAVEFLFARKLELSRQLADGRISAWPYCEAFIPTELARGGFKLAELSDFGATDRYDWKPAVVETDLPGLRPPSFVHPVLDPARYVSHAMRDIWPPERFFHPRSDVRRRLRRVTVRLYGPPLAAALWRRVIGAGRRWLSIVLGERSGRGS